MMLVQESGEAAVAEAIPSTGSETDRWNAVAVVLTLGTIALGVVVHLVLRAAGR